MIGFKKKKNFDQDGQRSESGTRYDSFSGRVGRLLKKLIFVVILACVGYGVFYLYSNPNAVFLIMQKVNTLRYIVKGEPIPEHMLNNGVVDAKTTTTRKNVSPELQEILDRVHRLEEAEVNINTQRAKDAQPITSHTSKTANELYIQALKESKISNLINREIPECIKGLQYPDTNYKDGEDKMYPLDFAEFHKGCSNGSVSERWIIYSADYYGTEYVKQIDVDPYGVVTIYFNNKSGLEKEKLKLLPYYHTSCITGVTGRCSYTVRWKIASDLECLKLAHCQNIMMYPIDDNGGKKKSSGSFKISDDAKYVQIRINEDLIDILNYVENCRKDVELGENVECNMDYIHSTYGFPIDYQTKFVRYVDIAKNGNVIVNGPTLQGWNGENLILMPDDLKAVRNNRIGTSWVLSSDSTCLSNNVCTNDVELYSKYKVDFIKISKNKKSEYDQQIIALDNAIYKARKGNKIELAERLEALSQIVNNQCLQYGDLKTADLKNKIRIYQCRIDTIKQGMRVVSR